jgi:hypothetical protein
VAFKFKFSLKKLCLNYEKMAEYNNKYWNQINLLPFQTGGRLMFCTSFSSISPACNYFLKLKQKYNNFLSLTLVTPIMFEFYVQIQWNIRSILFFTIQVRTLQIYLWNTHFKILVNFSSSPSFLFFPITWFYGLKSILY